MARIVVMTLLSVLTVLFGCTGTSGAANGPLNLPEERLETISKYLALGDAENAIAAYEKAAKDAPETVETKILHARLLLLAFRLDEAAEEIDIVLQSDPDNVDALYAKSLLYSINEDTKNQKAMLEKITALDSAYSEALASLGALYFQEKNYPQAEALFLKAVATDEKNLTAVLGLGNVKYRQKKWEEAKKYYNRAIEIEPTYPFTYSDRALVKRAQGDLAGALEDLNEAIKLEPDYSYNYYDRGRIYMDQGKLKAAINEFDRAIEKDPELFAAFVMRAGLHEELGNSRQAIADYETVLSLRKDYFYAYASLGTQFMLTRQFGKASTMFDKAFAFEPERYEYILLAALALKKEGKAGDAVTYLNSKLGLFPKDGWQYQVLLFYITPVVDFGAVNAANKEKNLVLRGRILYYLGAQYVLLEKIPTAKKYLAEAAEIDRPGMLEKKLAQKELESINAR